MWRLSYVYGVLVHFQHSPENLSCFQTCLVCQRVADVEELWERQGNNPVKVCAVLARLESVDFAYCQQALHTSKNRRNVSGVEQLYRDVEEVGPLLREVVCEDLLEGRDELNAHWWRRGNEDGDESVAEGRLLLLWYRPGLAVLFGGRPAL